MKDKRDFNLLFIMFVFLVAMFLYIILDELAANATTFISPVGNDPIVIEKRVEVPVAEPVPVSYKTFTCMKKHPETVERIKMYFGSEWIHATELYCRESSLDHTAVNPKSGACGLVQALPCSKLGCSLDDLDCQLKWGSKYIENRYGTAEEAVLFHDKNNWY